MLVFPKYWINRVRGRRDYSACSTNMCGGVNSFDLDYNIESVSDSDQRVEVIR